MRKLLLLLFLPLTLVACATAPLKAPKVVYIPVAATCPKVVVPPLPALPIQSPAFDTMQVGDQTRAVTESLAILMGDDKRLRTLISPYTEDAQK